MPIRFTDQSSRLARFRVTLADATSGFMGTAAHQLITGSINAQTVLTSALVGSFHGPASVAGTVSSILGNFTGAFSGTFAQAVVTGSALILGIDFTAGPTTGGEGNLGAHVSLYGINLGSFSDWGTVSNITIGGHAIGGYCSLSQTTGDNTGPGRGVYSTFGIQRLAFRVGPLTGAVAGTALPVQVSVNGSAPANSVSGGSYLDLDGLAITFTPQPGSIIYVSPTGSDSNDGSFANPKLTLQTTNGTGGVFKVNSNASTADGIKPGTHVVLRGGTHTATGGYHGRFVDLFRITGTQPSGLADRGPICTGGYGGAVGSNAPETPFISAPSAVGGIFNGNDSARASEAVSIYGGSFSGWAKDMQFANFKMASGATAGSDGGPMNMQSSAVRWRIFNCDISWPGSTVRKAAGIVGNGTDCTHRFNWIHDIFGTSTNENHGMYFDGSVDTSHRHRVSFTVIYNITGGNGIQYYDANVGNSEGHLAHHCWIEQVNKHGFNMADNLNSLTAYNMVIVQAGESALRFNTTSVTAASGIDLWNFTVYGWGRVVSARYAVEDDWNISSGSGSARIRNSIFMQAAGRGAGYGATLLNSGKVTFSNIRWYDPNGRFSTTTGGTFGDPGFTDAPNRVFTLANGSACIDAGASVTRPWGFALNSAPQGAAHDIGAYER